MAYAGKNGYDKDTDILFPKAKMDGKWITGGSTNLPIMLRIFQIFLVEFKFKEVAQRVQ